MFLLLSHRLTKKRFIASMNLSFSEHTDTTFKTQLATQCMFPFISLMNNQKLSNLKMNLFSIFKVYFTDFYFVIDSLCIILNAFNFQFSHLLAFVIFQLVHI